MTFQPQLSTSPKGSNRQRSQSTSSTEQLRNTLKEYDKDNDGYIYWNEFCDMAHDKQYNNSERDELWIRLGGDERPTQNSKISIQQIMQSSPAKQKGKKKFIRQKADHVNVYIKDDGISISHSRKLSNESRASRNSQDESYDDSIINNNKIKRSATPKGYQSYHTIPDFNINANSAKNKGYHSDEEPEIQNQRIQRANTSEKSMEAKQQLMDNPLILFEDFDLNRNGKLNQKEFANMLHKIYNSDDIKDNDDNNLFNIEIQKTFKQFDSDYSLDYKDNVHDLEEALRPYDNVPNKYDFLKLCVQIFSIDNNNINNINYNNNDDDSKQELEVKQTKNKDPIQYMHHIMEQFTVNAENKSKKKYQMAKITVQDLYEWIQQNAIPAIKDNENLRHECDTIKTNYSSLQHKYKLLCDEFDIKSKFTSELEITNKNSVQESLYKDNTIHDLKEKHFELENAYFALQKEYELYKKNKHFEEYSRSSTRDYIIENNRLKEELSSLKRQLNDSQNLYKEKVIRLQDELQKTRVIPGQTYLHTGISSHAGAFCIPNSDSDNYSNDSYDNEDSRYHGLHPRTNSHDSVRMIYDARSVSKLNDRIRTETSDSEACINTLENEFDNEDSKTQSRTDYESYYNDTNQTINNGLIVQFDRLNEMIKHEISELIVKEKGEIKDDGIAVLLQKQTAQIIENVSKCVCSITNNSIASHDRRVIVTYNEFYASHEKLINELNEKNKHRDKLWTDVIDKLKGQIGILSERLKDKNNELLNYKSEWESCFTEIMYNIKQKESTNREIFDKLKNEMNEMLVYVKCEENNVKEFKKAKENEINGLKEQLLMYKKGDDILKYIRQNMVHKNDCDEILQGQIKEIMDKMISMQDMIKDINLSEIKSELNEQRNVLKSMKQIVENKDDKNEIMKNLQVCVDVIKGTQNKIENVASIQTQLNDQRNILKGIEHYMVDEDKKREDECKSDEILRKQMKEIMDMIKKNQGLNNGILEIKEQLNTQQEVLKCVKENVGNGNINEKLQKEMKEIGNDIKCTNDKVDNVCKVVKEYDIKPIEIQLNKQENVLKNIEKYMNDDNNNDKRLKTLNEIESHMKVCVDEIKSAQNMIGNVGMEAKKSGLGNHISEIKLQLKQQEEVLKCVKQCIDKGYMKEMLEEDIKNIRNDLKTCVSVVECTKDKIENICKITMGLDIKSIETQLDKQENILKNIEQYMIGDDEKGDDTNEILQGQIKDVEMHLKECMDGIKSTGENVSKLLVENDIKEIKLRLNEQDNVLKCIKESVMNKNNNSKILEEIKQIGNDLQTCMNTKSQFDKHEYVIQEMKQNEICVSDNKEDNEILHKEIQQIGNNLKQCITDVKSTKDKLENISEVAMGLNGNNRQIQTQLDDIKQNMNNDNKKSDMLQYKMNEIENSVKTCINIMECTQNKMENMSKSSLKNNIIIEMQSQLKEQQKVLQLIKYNVFDINNNEDINNLQQVQDCINMKSVRHNNDILNKEMEQIRTDLNKCINTKKIQDCLCIKEQLSVDAIESAHDTIKNAQVRHEFENIDKFSCLGHNIYEIKSQLNDVYSVINDIKHAQNTHINETQNNGMNAIDIESVHSISTTHSHEKFSNLKEEIITDLNEKENYLLHQQRLYVDEQEEKAYMCDIRKISQFTEENEYKYELQNEHKLLLFELFEAEMNKLSFKMDKLLLLLASNKSNEYNDIINKYNNIYWQTQSNHKLLENNAKNIYECDSNNKIRMNNFSIKYTNKLENCRTKIGLDMSQNIRFLNEQQKEWYERINSELRVIINEIGSVKNIKNENKMEEENGYTSSQLYEYKKHIVKKNNEINEHNLFIHLQTIDHLRAETIKIYNKCIMENKDKKTFIEENKQLQTAKDMLKNENNKLKLLNDELHKSNNVFKIQINNNKSKMDELNELIKKLTDEKNINKKLKQERQQLKCERNKYKEEIIMRIKTNDSIMKDITERDKIIEILNDENKKWKTQYIQTNKQTSQLRQVKLKFESENNELIYQINELKNKIEYITEIENNIKDQSDDVINNR